MFFFFLSQASPVRATASDWPYLHQFFPLCDSEQSVLNELISRYIRRLTLWLTVFDINFPYTLCSIYVNIICSMLNGCTILLHLLERMVSIEFDFSMRRQY